MTYKTHVLLRCITAIVGGYAVASFFSIALVPGLVYLFDYHLSYSVMLATMFSYVVFFGIIIISFCHVPLTKLWIGLTCSTGLLFILFSVFPTP